MAKRKKKGRKRAGPAAAGKSTAPKSKQGSSGGQPAEKKQLAPPQKNWPLFWGSVALFALWLVALIALTINRLS